MAVFDSVKKISQKYKKRLTVDKEMFELHKSIKEWPYNKRFIFPSAKV